MKSDPGMTTSSRGLLRPNGTSRAPSFAIIGLLVVIAILAFNYWSVSSEYRIMSEESALKAQRHWNDKEVWQKRGQEYDAKLKAAEFELRSVKEAKEKCDNEVLDKMTKLDNLSPTITDLEKCKSSELQMNEQLQQFTTEINDLKDQVLQQEGDIATKKSEAENLASQLQGLKDQNAELSQRSCANEVATERIRILSLAQSLSTDHQLIQKLSAQGVDTANLPDPPPDVAAGQVDAGQAPQVDQNQPLNPPQQQVPSDNNVQPDAGQVGEGKGQGLHAQGEGQGQQDQGRMLNPESQRTVQGQQNGDQGTVLSQQGEGQVQQVPGQNPVNQGSTGSQQTVEQQKPSQQNGEQIQQPPAPLQTGAQDQNGGQGQLQQGQQDRGEGQAPQPQQGEGQVPQLQQGQGQSLQYQPGQVQEQMLETTRPMFHPTTAGPSHDLLQDGRPSDTKILTKLLRKQEERQDVAAPQGLGVVQAPAGLTGGGGGGEGQAQGLPPQPQSPVHVQGDQAPAAGDQAPPTGDQAPPAGDQAPPAGDQAPPAGDQQQQPDAADSNMQAPAPPGDSPPGEQPPADQVAPPEGQQQLEPSAPEDGDQDPDDDGLAADDQGPVLDTNNPDDEEEDEQPAGADQDALDDDQDALEDDQDAPEDDQDGPIDGPGDGPEDDQDGPGDGPGDGQDTLGVDDDEDDELLGNDQAPPGLNTEDDADGLDDEDGDDGTI